MKKILGFAAAVLLASNITAFAFEPGNTECIAPANPGGGWDFTCRQVGKALQDLSIIPGTMQVTNLAGGEAVTQLLAGSVQAFTGDASEAKGFVDSGDIRVIAVLAPERLEGDFSSFPTAKEQGIDVIGANWRGFYGPGNMPDDAYNYWVESIGKVYDSKEWKDIMAANGLAPLDLQGAEFQAFVKESVDSITDLSKQIGILK